MNILRALPGFLALLILAAHFLRAGEGLALFMVLPLFVFIFIRRTWAVRTVQIGLALGSIEWLLTLWMLVQERRMVGMPYLRLTIILGAVAVLTGLSGLILRTKHSSEAADSGRSR